MSEYQDFTTQYIGGTWRRGSGATALVDRNPYTGEALTEIATATIGDVDAAYAAARDAQRSWAATGPSERVDLFRRVLTIVEARREEIVGWLVRESGSTILKAGLEWSAMRGGLIEALSLPSRVEGRIMPIDQPDTQSFVYRKPLGVIGIISPWNFPLHLSHRSIAPALATGNAVVVKPAEDTPVTGGLLIAKIYKEAGLPPGLLNVVVGDPAEIGDAFVDHPVPRLISFTGSTRVGKRIAQRALGGAILKHVGLELGGNAPIVVLDDADLDHAVRAAIVSRFLHSGQICMSGNRIIVDTAVHNAFVERFVDHAASLRVGDPADAATVIGPLINERQKDAALRNIAQARAAGFTQRLGGEAEGLVVPPHVFTGVPNDSAFAQAEQFAPIAPIIKVDGEADALRVANDTSAGLSSAIFTTDASRALRFAQQIETGMVHINDLSVMDSPFNMFGGEKDSGVGRFNGAWIIDEFTTDQWVTLRNGGADYPF